MAYTDDTDSIATVSELSAPPTTNSDAFMSNASNMESCTIKSSASSIIASEPSSIDPEAIDWAQLPDFQPLTRHSKKQRRGWVWQHGYEVERRSDGRRMWL